MGWWKSLGHRIAHVGRRSSFEEDLSAEIEFHLDSLIEELQRGGLSRDEAVLRARREFGSRLRTREEARRAWQFSWVEHLASNIRYGLRQARRNPAFAVIVVATLGLGIGANAAVFSAIDAVLLQSLPFPEGDRLMRVYQRNPKTPVDQTSPARLADWDRMNHTFQALSGFYTEDVSEASGELPEKLTRAFVAPRFLEVWAVVPILGRDFTPEEQRDGGSAVLVSDRFWRKRFGMDPTAVGRRLRIGDSSPTIVGVMPATFAFPVRNVDIWVPVTLNSFQRQFRDAGWYTTIGRVKPGVSVPRARADLATVQSQLGQQYPESDASLGVDVQPLASEVVGTVRSSLWLLFGSATLLLLIASVNVAGLLLVRAIERGHEISIRVSLGASRRFVAAQLMTETGLLALGGALVGLVIATLAARTFRVFAGSFPRADEIQVDWRVGAYSLVAVLVVTFGCGLVPVLRATGMNVNTGLLGTGRSSVSGRNRVQRTFAAIQVALAVVLLTGAGLLVRSFQELARVSPGFDPSRIATFHVSGSYAETVDFARLTARMDRTLDFVRSIPGIEAAATAGALPGVPGQFQTEVRLVEGRADSEPKLIAENRIVSPSYFVTLQIPLLAGEPCRETPPSSVRSTVVNRSFADAYFPGRSPIGHQINTPLGGLVSGTIHGIVANVREQGLHHAPVPTVYWCLSAPGPAPYFLIRTTGAPRGMAETLRRKMKDLEPSRAVFDVSPLADALDDSYRDNRLRMVILTTFAAVAVFLACVGLYGTLSYLVNSRRREVGLRLALGALRGQIVRLFFAQGLAIAALACVAGLAMSVVGGRWMSSMLFGVSPMDPLTLTMAALIVLTGAAFASLVPATRGAFVDPMRVLRDE